MRHGSLFSGIGGFDLAAQWMGWDNVFHCEWNPFGQKVLHYYWPEAEQFTDITKSDFTKYANRIDILTGGFPCQPYSMAGKRLGKEDERHLWPEMLRAIREIQPTWIVGENVFGLINWNGGMVFDEVQADLEAQGYEVQPYVLPAAAVNAPHRRDRVWFVAHSNDNGHNTNRGEIPKKDRVQGINRKEMGSGESNGADIPGDASNTNSSGCKDRNEQYRGESTSCGEGECSSSGHSTRSDKTFTNTKDIRREDALENGKLEGGRLRESYKRDAWDSFPSVSPICTGDDGLSDRLDSITFSKWRTESIKAGGNAIVPQVALQIFKAIDQYERL